MKIIWIVNTPIDILGEKLYGNRENGVWMDALLSDYRKNGGFELVVATAAKIKKTLCFENESVRFFAIPDNVPILYNENKHSNVAAWDDLIKNEKPDLVQVWGTEFSHGLCALKACKKHNIPSVIYMQGYLGSIARHYLAQIDQKDIKRNVTLRDILKHDNLITQQKRYFTATNRECEEFLLSGRIICENGWCEQSIKAVCPDIKVYRCPLSINEAFSKAQWNVESCEKHSLICNASGYPLKGLHMMLHTLALLKRKYPDVKLYVPGTKMICDNSLIARIRKNGYTKYIEKLIIKLDLEGNIVWLGQLTHDELAKQYLKTHVFVLCSAIENHSSSLKEAMITGLPCVASAVGGVPEYLRHGENGFLYRFEEYDIAAAYIEKIFEDDDLAIRLSAAGQADMKKLHSNNNVFARMFEIYHDITEEN